MPGDGAAAYAHALLRPWRPSMFMQAGRASPGSHLHPIPQQAWPMCKPASHSNWLLVNTPAVASVSQEVFKTQYYLCIAMEFCDGGDLSQYIDNRTHHRVFGLLESQARWLFQQLMVAVDYCHRLGIVNRDIKVLPGR